MTLTNMMKGMISIRIGQKNNKKKIEIIIETK